MSDSMFVNKLRLIVEQSAMAPSREDRADFDLYEETGGNLDDAYALGGAEGEIAYARHLLVLIDELEIQEIG